jgi:DNA repair photolyase
VSDFKAGGKTIKLSFDSFEEIIEREAPLIEGKTLYMNVMTDPYQPHIRNYTKLVLEKCLPCNPKKIVIQTRSPLVAQDIEIFSQYPTNSLRINMTVETNDDSVRRDFAPSSPGLEARWKALEAVSRAGIDVCITCTPTLPFSRSQGDLQRWLDRVNSLPTVTHVVSQPLKPRSGFTSTPEEAWALVPKYQKFFDSGYARLLDEFKSKLRVPLVLGEHGFAP